MDAGSHAPAWHRDHDVSLVPGGVNVLCSTLASVGCWGGVVGIRNHHRLLPHVVSAAADVVGIAGRGRRTAVAESA